MTGLAESSWSATEAFQARSPCLSSLVSIRHPEDIAAIMWYSPFFFFGLMDITFMRYCIGTTRWCFHAAA